MIIEEVKLTYKNKISAKHRHKITSSKDAYEILLKTWDQDQIELLEECKALFLDRQLRVMSIASISKGGFSGTVVDLRIVFAIALKRRADSLILAHNHPSGNLRPSDADIRLTRSFQDAGNIMGILLQDHLVVTKEAFTSIVSEL